MSPESAVVTDNRVMVKKKVLIPPEQKFWQRYSPHHEFPWSTVISVSIYVFAGLLVFALVRLAIRDSEDNKSLPVAMIAEPEGGGGNREGVGMENPGDLPVPKEAIQPAAGGQPAAAAPQPKNEDLDDVAPDKVHGARDSKRRPDG